METLNFKFGLGEILRDKVTGFQGAVMVRAQYFTGCIHYGLCPQELKDGKVLDWEWIDTSRLERVPKAKRITPESSVGPTSGPEPRGPQL